MGDYSLGHFRFALKRGTPKDVIDKVDGLVRGEPFELDGHRVYLGDSAYHNWATTAEAAAPHDEAHAWPERGPIERIYAMTFQIKYGCAQLEAFARFLEPHVYVNKSNSGWFGYKISEHADTVTTFIVGGSR